MNIYSFLNRIITFDVWIKLFNRFKKKLLKSLSFTIWKNTFDVVFGNNIIAYWWRGSDNRNWGDKINPFLVQHLSDKNVVHPDDVINFRFLNVHTCIGSVVEHLRFEGVHLWGPGIISESSAIKIYPANIHAVRGPLTRQRLLDEGYDCPDIYGDPALLLPKYYQPKVEKNIELGIVPHYIDKENEEILRLKEEGACIIDVFSGESEFIDKINRCKRIVSSSLHGLIVADAYGISSKWMKASDNIFGDEFKYHDYYESIGITDEEPLLMRRKISYDDLLESCWKKDLDIDLERLLIACPYYDRSNEFSEMKF